MMINPLEYHGVCGGGTDDRVERWGRTGGSSVHPWGSVNLIDELRVALMPPRWRVSFLLGSAVSSSILWGDSETECLLEEVVDDGLDIDDPFFLVQRLVVFFHGCSTLSLTYKYPEFSAGNKVHKYYFGVWTLSGLRMWFVARNKQGEWLSLRWLWTTNLSTRTKRWMGDLPLPWLGSSPAHSCLLCFFVTACTFQMFSSTPSLALLLLPLDVFALTHFHTPLPHMPPWYSCKTKTWLPPMLVICMWFDKKCWRGIPWCIMVHVWLG
jgi:hypothetical protein